MNHRLRQENGASLILVIIFVMVFAIISAALLEFASTGFETTKSVADVRNDQHGLDGAMDGAINAIRRSSTAGFVGFCPTFEYDGSADGHPDDPRVKVVCTPLPSSTTGGVDDRFPKYAVMLLGTAADEGYEQLQFNTVTVDGGIFSNSRIEIVQTNARMHVFGDAFGVGPCTTAKMIVTGALVCTGVTVIDPDDPTHQDYPNYPMAIDDIDDLAEIKPADVTCTPGGVTKFPSGRYLTHPGVLAARRNCSSSVWWFQPGAYYFGYEGDLPINDRNGKTTGSPAGFAHVIGGTRSSAWGDSTPGGSITMPGACDAGTLDAPNPGVQLILGEESNLFAQNNNGSKLEFCGGEFPGTGQRIVVYSLGQGHDRGAPTPVETKLAKSSSSTGTPSFVVPSAAEEIDGVDAVASLGRNESATITLADFFDDIPEGATISEASLTIDHDVPSSASWSITLEDDDAATGDIALDSGDVSGGSIDLLDHLHEDFRWMQIRDLELDYTVARGNAGGPTSPPAATTLDGIELEISYIPPGLQSPSDHYRDPAHPLIVTESNAIAMFKGTVYAPNAWLDLRIHNSGRTAFNRGVIAWAILGTMNQASTQTDAPFSLGGEEGVRRAVLEAFVDENDDDAPDGDKPRLRALVSFDDTGELPGRGVTIHDWALLRQ